MFMGKFDFGDQRYRGDMKFIKIKNASLHNLKNVSVDIPKNKLVVVTGVSGSGKTSLICDILDEAGSSDYLENLGLFQESFFQDCYESICGLSPTVILRKRNEGMSNPRSLVGTKTRILKELRLLYLTDGEIPCNSCGQRNRLHKTNCICGAGIPPVSGRELSPNSSVGKCTECEGMGYILEADLEVIYQNQEKALTQLCGMIPGCAPLKNQLSFFAESLEADLDLPFEKQPPHVQDAFCNGLHSPKSNFRGIGPYLKKRYAEGKSHGGKIKKRICPACNGDRLHIKGRSIRVKNMTLPEVSQMSITEIKIFVLSVFNDETTTDVGKNICKILVFLLEQLIRVGLGYLNLYRTIPSLSGGEFQRLKLASLLGGAMEDMVMIADEPLTGLHPAEKRKVLEQMRYLCDRGNSVILIEHNTEAMKMADHIIDFGVYGGIRGGNIIYTGDYEGLVHCEESITARYIRNRETPSFCHDAGKGKLRIQNACVNNLKGIDVEFPLHTLVGITGVSGSGKSSLIAETLVPLLKDHFGNSDSLSEESDGEELFYQDRNAALFGADNIDGFAYVSQSPIGRNPKSIVATYAGIMERIQALFAKQEKEEETDVKYKGKSISQVLDMTVEEGIQFFNAEKKIQNRLFHLKDLGLDHLTLGQPVQTLSGGEGQRLKLGKSLLEKKKNMLYLFDEPSIGLSLYDIDKMNQVFYKLLQHGHSVIVVEHDVHILSNCKWLIELGPGADESGGFVIAKGTPEDLKKDKNSMIADYLIT